MLHLFESWLCEKTYTADTFRKRLIFMKGLNLKIAFSILKYTAYTVKHCFCFWSVVFILQSRCSALLSFSFRRFSALTSVMREKVLWYMQCILHTAKMYFYILYLMSFWSIISPKNRCMCYFLIFVSLVVWRVHCFWKVPNKFCK